MGKKNGTEGVGEGEKQKVELMREEVLSTSLTTPETPNRMPKLRKVYERGNVVQKNGTERGGGGKAESRTDERRSEKYQPNYTGKT